MKRRFRIFAAVFAAVALLFAQLAVSAYACSKGDGAAPAAVTPCEQAVASPNLCERHCDYGNASFEPAKPVHASPDLMGPGMRIAMIWTAAQRARASFPPLVVSGPSPPSSRFTVLRI